ncbi:MAG TPA: hypothetical protein DIC32_08320 [Acinetobacter radioresistens]|uniref:Scaffold protein n=1 Tax=Acinetobacter radioresistens TaxID=40216 RepID=A0A3D3G1W1_ACIRA|nr:hypothetical protein [Acinetobacter radioresistens]
MFEYELDSLEGLEESQKAFYEEKDGKFVLKVKGIPQPQNDDGLRKKVDELLAEKKAEQQKRKEAEEQARKEAEENARKNGNIEALEKSWGEKFTARETELLNEKQALEAQVYKLTVGSKATELAAKLAVPGSDSVLLPHISNRLQVETVDGEIKIRVLDLQGKPSALSIEDLEKEFRANEAFKPLIRASNASGSGASGGQGGGATKKPSEMNQTERADWQKNDPEGFAQAVASGAFNPI